MRERSRVETEWPEPDRTRMVPNLRKVESKKRVVLSVTISSGSEDSEGSVWNRVVHPRRSVLSESEEEEKVGKRAWRATSAGGQKARAVKLLKDWGLKFSGDEREDPEEFLERLEDCRKGAEMGDQGLLIAIPCILTEKDVECVGASPKPRSRKRRRLRRRREREWRYLLPIE